MLGPTIETGSSLLKKILHAGEFTKLHIEIEDTESKYIKGNKYSRVIPWLVQLCIGCVAKYMSLPANICVVFHLILTVMM